MSGIARSEPHDLEDQICMYVFDLVDISGKVDQDTRIKKLNDIFNTRGFEKKYPHIKLTDTKLVHSLKEIYDYHDDCTANNYEGVIIRARDLKYEKGKRSNKMRKYKHFLDREYVIIGTEKDPGVDDEYFVWVCKDLELDKTFKAKPKGTREQRNHWYTNYANYLGQRLTVKFQEYTEDGVPRFPVGVCIREDQ